MAITTDFSVNDHFFCIVQCDSLTQNAALENSFNVPSQFTWQLCCCSVHVSLTLPPSPQQRRQVSCYCMERAKGNLSVAYPNSIFCSVELNWSKHSFSTAPFTTFQHFTAHNIISLHDRHNWPKTPYAKLVGFFGRSISSFHSYHMT